VRAPCSATLSRKKKIVKTLKIYLRDAGILHPLLGIQNMKDLLGHPIYGASCKRMAVEQALQKVTAWQAGFIAR